MNLIFKAADNTSLSLLAAMLLLDPRRRLLPTAALETHAFFTTCNEKQQRDAQAGAATRIQTLPSAHARGVATTKRTAAKRSSVADGGNEQRRARLGNDDDSEEDARLRNAAAAAAAEIDVDGDGAPEIKRKLEY